MLLSPQISWKRLAQFTRRLATALAAGLDVRRCVQRESEQGSPYHQRRMQAVRQAIDAGESLPHALQQADPYFPKFFVEMVGVGDQTGKLDHILPKLADYYDFLLGLRRMFLIAIAWPMLQLSMAIGIIGLLILALGWIADTTGQVTDILGLGLVGTRGFIRYLLLLGTIAACGMILYRVLSRGVVAYHVRQWAMHTPGLGPAVRLLSLSRFAWSLGLALDSGADARTAARLALSSTANDYYCRHLDAVDQGIRSGRELNDVLRSTGAFPVEFLDAVELGEQSGRTSELLLKMAEDYQENAKLAMRGVTLFAGIAVWLGVASVIIFLIFRIAGFYFNLITDLSKP